MYFPPQKKLLHIEQETAKFNDLCINATHGQKNKYWRILGINENETKLYWKQKA